MEDETAKEALSEMFSKTEVAQEAHQEYRRSAVAATREALSNTDWFGRRGSCVSSRGEEKKRHTSLVEVAKFVETLTPAGKAQRIVVPVGGQIPPELKGQLLIDFTFEEKKRIYSRTNLTLARPADEPGALFVLGPPAVGKSSLASARAGVLFGAQENAVVVDGAEFREEHGGFQAIRMHGMQHAVLHTDAWKIFKDTGHSSKLKTEIFEEALEARLNLLIPDCATQPKKLEESMARCAARGYELHAICLWAPLSETRRRGELRSTRDGKRWTPTQYAPAVRGTLATIHTWLQRMREEPDRYKSLSLWDNTVFPPKQLTVDEFEALSLLDEPRAGEHLLRLSAGPTGGRKGSILHPSLTSESLSSSSLSSRASQLSKQPKRPTLESISSSNGLLLPEEGGAGASGSGTAPGSASDFAHGSAADFAPPVPGSDEEREASDRWVAAHQSLLEGALGEAVHAAALDAVRGEARAPDVLQAVAERLLALARKSERGAAAVQAAVRGKQARSKQAEEKAAATTVQAAVRGRRARAQFAEAKDATVHVQAAVRGKLARDSAPHAPPPPPRPFPRRSSFEALPLDPQARRASLLPPAASALPPPSTP